MVSLRDNMYIKMLLGEILTLGNILNARNDTLGQADGFRLSSTLPAFCKKKDNNKDSALYQLCI